MPREKCTESFSAKSNQMKTNEFEECARQAKSRELLFNKKTIKQNNKNASEKAKCHAETNFDFRPWFDLEVLKKGSKVGSVNETVGFKERLDDPQKKKEMYQKIHADDEDDLTSDEDLSEEDNEKRRRKMMGYMD